MEHFDNLTEVCTRFRRTPCVYVQTDKKGKVIHIGKASKGLERRYRGGTSYALDAAMHASGNKVYVAEVTAQNADIIGQELIWNSRIFLLYNNQGKKTEPKQRIRVIHEGDSPNFRS